MWTIVYRVATCRDNCFLHTVYLGRKRDSKAQMYVHLARGYLVRRTMEVVFAYRVTDGETCDHTPVSSLVVLVIR